MDYKIVEFNAATGQIVVEFLLIEGYRVAIDLPIDAAGNVPVGDELSLYIKGFLPYNILERKALLANGVANLEAFLAHVEPTPPAVDANLTDLV